MIGIEYKPTCVIRAPVTTRSGYGAMSRDIVRHIIEMDEYIVKVHSCRWGDTPMNALDPNNKQDQMIIDKIVPEVLDEQPDLYISITIPTEFIPHGRYNIGITAGIETSAATPQWVDALNRMDLVVTISQHSKNVFLNSKYGEQNARGQIIRQVQAEKPIEVLPNCVDTYTFKKVASHELEPTVKEYLKDIEEEYCFLFVGHWLNGNLGHDRKNVGLLVKIFYELFKRKEFTVKPGLILKTSGGTTSLLDREAILKKINEIRNSVPIEDGQTLPNIYLVHGDLTDSEMNSLYNHPKVKTHISLTRGEGFGRPLLEASLTGKPIIASGWSGHLDFLNSEDNILLGGKLEVIDQSSMAGDWMMQGSSWFQPDQNMIASAMIEVLNNYLPWKQKANTIARRNKENFSYKKVQKMTADLLHKYVPEFTAPPRKVDLVLPLLDAPDNLPKLDLPKLNLPEFDLPTPKPAEMPE